MPKFLSYSAQACFFKDREEYVLRYLVDRRVPRSPQEKPASIGSAFDAKVKSFLHNRIYGSTPEYEFETLFERQVEKQNRDWARGEVDHVYDSYQVSGMLDELIALIDKATTPPRFEFDVTADIRGVPILGKPDCAFGIDDLTFLLDWKVNGYLSTRGISPVKGYRLCKDGWKEAYSRSHDKAHKMYKGDPKAPYGVSEHYMEDCGVDGVKWAEQLSMYAWALGAPIGSEQTVLMIDQLSCRPIVEGRPRIRVSNYRSRVRDAFQDLLADKLVECWDRIQKPETIFDSEDSAERFERLNRFANQMDGSPEAEYYNEITRAEYRG